MNEQIHFESSQSPCFMRDLFHNLQATKCISPFPPTQNRKLFATRNSTLTTSPSPAHRKQWHLADSAFEVIAGMASPADSVTSLYLMRRRLKMPSLNHLPRTIICLSGGLIKLKVGQVLKIGWLSMTWPSLRIRTMLVRMRIGIPMALNFG